MTLNAILSDLAIFSFMKWAVLPTPNKSMYGVTAELLVTTD